MRTGSYFPFGAPRDGQREFLRDVGEAVAQGRHLVAHAPTGIGKTVSTLAPALEHAVRNGKRVFFLTSKQSQHRIAVDTIRAIRASSGAAIVGADIISKQDMCPRREAKELFSKRFARFCRHEQVSKQCDYWTTANAQAVKVLREEVRHVEDEVEVARTMHVCPHQAVIEAAQVAHVVVCDYNWFFSDMRSSVQEKLKAELKDVVLVVDEAHNLPDRIRDHLAYELNDYVLSDARDELRDLGDDALGAALERLQEGLIEATEPLAEVSGRPEKAITREEGHDILQAALAAGRRSLVAWDLDAVTRELEGASERYEKRFKDPARGIGNLLAFLGSWRVERRGIVRILTRDPVPAIQYKMLDPSLLARAVFEQVHASVLMSGTLHPPAMVRDVLGLDPARTLLRTYESPFPRANRLVLVDDQVTTQYTERSDETFSRIASRLAEVAEASPGAVAAFFPSYRILEDVRQRLPLDLRKEVIVESREHSKDEKEGLVQALRDGADALLLGVQGGSLSEGYDYAGNLLKAVVIVGLPFAAPSLEVEALIGYYTQRFGPGTGRTYAYVKPTMDRVLQAAGRLIRSETDRGVIVLMDKRFAWKQYRELYPPDLSPAVVDEPAEQVRRFWA